MDRLLQMIGREQDLDEVARALYAFAREGRAPVVGAVHLTCADESELECVRATRRAFAEHVLPKLKSGTRAPFRLANLGARYEWGAAAVADEHYSLDPARADHKLLAIKINSHVCVDTSSGDPRYGTMRRYDHDSHFCGALHHLLGGGNLPFTREMRQSFGSDGLDRLAALRDPEQVPQELRSLFAALVNARLQARKAAIDIQARRPLTPTLFFLLACVTLNRLQKDTEIVCGACVIDWREEGVEARYCGLGDDPSRYRLTTEAGGLLIEDDQPEGWRPARSPRERLLEDWLRMQGVDPGTGATAVTPGIAELIEREGGTDQDDAPRQRLQQCLTSLSRHDPVPAAMLAWGRGLADVHHLYEVERLARGTAGEEVARAILREIHSGVEGMSPQQAADALRLLAS